MHQGLIMAELLHFLSFLALYVQIQKNKNCQGISYKTQELYLVVFITRFSDLFNYQENIEIIMKIIYLLCTIKLIYIMRLQKPICLTYVAENDSFPHVYIYPIVLILTALFHTGWSIINLCQSFSMWLEVFAIIPQLNLIRRLKEAENLTGYYVFLLGIYRLLYIISWICKYLHSGWWCWTSILSGLYSSANYADFLYHFIKNRGQYKVNV